jgi:hypothetical protein
MTVTSNPTAIAMIEEMIESNELTINYTNANLAIQLRELARMTETITEQLEQGYNIDSRWLSEKAAKAEESIAKRRSLYENRATLLHVLKAAGAPVED